MVVITWRRLANTRLRLIAIIFVCLLQIDVSVACEFKFSSGGFMPTVNYNVFGGASYDHVAHVEIERVDRGDIDNSRPTCDARIRLHNNKKNILAGGGRQLSYEFVADSKDQQADGYIDRVKENLQPGQRYRWEYAIRIIPGQLVPSGSYSALLNVTVGEDRLAVGQQLAIDDGLQIDIEAVVPASARVSFAGVQGRSRIVDFGSIENGSEPVFQPVLLVQATDSYQLRFRSDNDGALVRNGSDTSSTLQYDLKVDGKFVDLTSARSGLLVKNSANGVDSRVPLSFSIPDAGGIKAGLYRDRVVVHVYPILR